MTDAWTLHGSGRREHRAWEHLHAITRSWTAAWADVAGFHLDQLPDEPPVTTHLWAWTTNTWLRVRLDGNHWWAALLARDSSEEEEIWRTSAAIPQPTITGLRHWQSDAGQTKQYRGADGIIDTHDTIQLVPLRRTTGVFIGSTDSLHEAR